MPNIFIGIFSRSAIQPVQDISTTRERVQYNPLERELEREIGRTLPFGSTIQESSRIFIYPYIIFNMVNPSKKIHLLGF